MLFGKRYVQVELADTKNQRRFEDPRLIDFNIGLAGILLITSWSADLKTFTSLPILQRNFSHL